MLRGAHSEHTTAIWRINVNFLGNMEHTSAIWRIALQKCSNATTLMCPDATICGGNHPQVPHKP